jgi:ATP-dependent Lon protease
MLALLPSRSSQGLKITKTGTPRFYDRRDRQKGASTMRPIHSPSGGPGSEQNNLFRTITGSALRHLPRVLIVTANTLDSIPGPLIDRWRSSLPGYVDPEKLEIARITSSPQTMEKNGIRRGSSAIPGRPLIFIADPTRGEAGVRNFEKYWIKYTGR